MTKKLHSSTAEDLEILIVDDDKIVCLLHKKSLERISPNAPIKVFHNGCQAMGYLVKQQESSKKFLILLDINMPVLNGWEFLELCSLKIRKDIYSTVMVTSSINTYDKHKAMGYSKVVGFLEKPLSLQQAEVLRELNGIRNFFR